MNTPDHDEFAGLPMLEWVNVPVLVWHPRSAPFGDQPMRKIVVPAGACYFRNKTYDSISAEENA